MIGSIIIFAIIGLAGAGLVYYLSGSFVGFYVVAGFFGIMLLYNIVDNLKNYHPRLWRIFCAILAIIGAIIAISTGYKYVVLFVSMGIGFMDGYTLIGDSDTEWYDTYWFEIDEWIYKFTDEHRTFVLVIIAIILLVAIHSIFALPYVLSEWKFLAFLPAVFYIFKFIVSLKRDEY